MDNKKFENNPDESRFEEGVRVGIRKINKFKEWRDGKLKIWNERLSKVFDKFAFLDQEDEIKAEISKSVVEDAVVGKLYWFQIILSALIATLGLLQNSVAVVIGAMLIAPLFIPLQALAFSITEGKKGLFWRSVWLIVMSTLISVFVAYLVVMVVPLQVETSEILARVSPNIYDLFIAGFSAVIALLALVYKRLSQSVAGVAMAASLMPPLAVIGIQIGFENIDKAFGAVLLYSTNIVAIVLVGVLMFLLYGFNPHQDKSYSVIAQGVFLLLVAVGLSIPLVASIQNEQEKADLYMLAEKSLEVAMDEVIPEGELSGLEVNSDGEIVVVGVDLRLPEEVDLFEGDLQSFTTKVSEYLEREVELNLDIIRTASLTEKVDDELLIRSSISDYVRSRFRGEFLGKTLVNLNLDKDEDVYVIQMIYIYENEDIGEDAKRAFEGLLKVQFPEENFDLKWILLNADDEEEQLQDEAEAVGLGLVDFLKSELPSNWYFVDSSAKRLRASGEIVYDVNLLLSLPDDLRSEDGGVSRSVEFRMDQLVKKYKEKLPEGDLTVSYEIFFRSQPVRIEG
jgi:uncharacterized hydrophobic protein (TIGR00271 family)